MESLNSNASRYSPTSGLHWRPEACCTSAAQIKEPRETALTEHVALTEMVDQSQSKASTLTRDKPP